MNKSKVIMALIISVLIFSSCNNTEPTELVDSTINEEIKADEIEKKVVVEEDSSIPLDNSEIKLSMRIPKTLNPILNSDISVDRILKLIFQPIAGLDENLKAVRNENLVSNISYAIDGTSATIELNPNAKWSDGTSISSDDIEFTINLIKQAPETSIYKSRVSNILSCEKLTEQSVIVKFNTNVLTMPYNFDFPIIPKHYYDGELVLDSEKNMTPLGNGHYRFADQIPIKEVNLVQDTTNFPNKINITKIKVVIIRDEETDYYAFDQRIIEAVTGSVSEWSKYLNSKEYNSFSYVSNYFDFVGFNFNNSELIKKNIREAIYMSTDWDKLVNSVYIGYAQRALTPVNPTSWLYESEVVNLGYDTEKAKVIIAENSIEKTLGILVNTENEPRVKIAETLKENLENIGLKVELISLPYNEYVEKLNNRDYDLFVGGLNMAKNGDLSFAFHSSASGSGQNYFDYRNEQIDNLIFNVNNSVDEITYGKSMSKLQKEIAKELPLISIAFRKSVVILDQKIKGNIVPTIDGGYGNINEWYFTK